MYSVTVFSFYTDKHVFCNSAKCAIHYVYTGEQSSELDDEEPSAPPKKEEEKPKPENLNMPTDDEKRAASSTANGTERPRSECSCSHC